MKKIYKLVAVLLAISVCLTVSVSAETLTYETREFIYEYSLDGNGNATIERVEKNNWNPYVLTIPETLENHPVVAIADHAYPTLSTLYRVELPASILSIGENAFNECSYPLTIFYGGTESQWATLMQNTGEQNELLTTASMYFTENDFSYCIHSKGYAKLDRYRGAEDTTELNIPASLGGWEVRSISCGMMGVTLLTGYKNIEKVTFPDTVVYISDAAFAGLPLKEVVLPSNLEIIADKCFAYCTDLTTVTIPDSLPVLPYLFEGCNSLKDIYFEGTQTEWNAYEIAEYIPLYHPEAVVHFGEASGQCGDYDDNGDINMNDALKLFQGVAGKGSLGAIFSAMDVNGDGVVNMFDALLLYEMVS